ncbi:family 43 glycosylhydrolase [Catellatospora sp. TT07R-123]|uniref:family 43 glycosylhydrolase n=1 Tax=Catellatospora sp. TT07R-123 TaxID=2733863 RepID=UPI001BB3C990|nr:family 43 glycosylhydrolase [Catellatospora sp. TT07R-123]
MRKSKRTTLITTAAALLLLASQGAAYAAAPTPVYAPSSSIADPGVLRENGDFYVYSTGSAVRVSRGDEAAGPWTDEGAGLDLTPRPAWMADDGIWAPDVWRTSAGLVMYFSAVAKDFGGQRCIGVAVNTGTDPGATFQPTDHPLVCPGGRQGGDDRVPGRPIADAGVIDPSPFTDSDGKRFLLYKTQQTPSTLRMVRLTADGVSWFGSDSGELLQRDGIIENPVLVQRGSQFVLLASRYGYDNCSYATVWLRSTDRWHFGGATEHSLLTTAGSGICGPGGADVTESLDGGWRLLLHGWVCGTGTKPCTTSQIDGGADHRRSLYAAVLSWGADGATPTVGAFL